MRGLGLLVVLGSSWLAPLAAQGDWPVIDMHLHVPANANAAAMRATLDSMNVHHAVLIGGADQLRAWGDTTGRALPSLTFPCEDGLVPNAGYHCLSDGGTWPDTGWLRREVQAGHIRMFGELTGQYFGVAPDDPRMEPYYALAQELDIPVGIHLGIGPPGVAYEGSRFPPRKSPRYSGPAGDPLALERVLVRYPRLRIYVMHAAWPFLDSMIYLMYMHPQLYADVSVLQYAIPRPAYYDYLRRLMEAGFGKRLMFGSDGGARQLVEGIAAIRAAPFLSEEEKHDLLSGNATRFLRL